MGKCPTNIKAELECTPKKRKKKKRFGISTQSRDMYNLIIQIFLLLAVKNHKTYIPQQNKIKEMQPSCVN